MMHKISALFQNWLLRNPQIFCHSARCGVWVGNQKYFVRTSPKPHRLQKINISTTLIQGFYKTRGSSGDQFLRVWASFNYSGLQNDLTISILVIRKLAVVSTYVKKQKFLMHGWKDLKICCSFQQ